MSMFSACVWDMAHDQLQKVLQESAGAGLSPEKTLEKVEALLKSWDGKE